MIKLREEDIKQIVNDELIEDFIRKPLSKKTLIELLSKPFDIEDLLTGLKNILIENISKKEISAMLWELLVMSVSYYRGMDYVRNFEKICEYTDELISADNDFESNDFSLLEKPELFFEFIENSNSNSLKYLLLGFYAFLKIINILNDEESHKKVDEKINISKVLYDTGNYEEVLIYANEAVMMIDEDDDYYISIIDNIKGLTLMSLGRLEEAYKCLQSALMRTDRAFSIFSKEYAVVLCNVAKVLFMRQDYMDALENLEAAEGALLKFGDDSEIGELYNNYAMIYSEIDRFDDAIYYFYKALEIFADNEGETSENCLQVKLNILKYHYDLKNYHKVILMLYEITHKFKDTFKNLHKEIKEEIKKIYDDSINNINTIYFLGDSVFDNSAHIGKGESFFEVFSQVYPKFEAKLIAKETSKISDINSQLYKVYDKKKSKIYLSVGGNDLFNAKSSLSEVIDNPKLFSNKFKKIFTDFDYAYDELMKEIKLSGVKDVTLCTIYNPTHYASLNDPIDELSESILTAFNECIKKHAYRNGFKILDLNSIFDDKKYFTNFLTPSFEGSKLLVNNIF